MCYIAQMAYVIEICENAVLEKYVKIKKKIKNVMCNLPKAFLKQKINGISTTSHR